MAVVARELAEEARVLCFDEFQVTDIADAMILRRLLEGLLECGVVCVITSKCVSLPSSPSLSHPFLPIPPSPPISPSSSPYHGIVDAYACGMLVCVCACVNNSRHPDDLYKNGIQRSSFIPAIDLLKSRFDVTDLDSGTDYRRLPRALSSVYHHPLNPSTRAEMDKLFLSLSHSHAQTQGIEEEEVRYDRELDIWGRKLKVPKSTSKVAMFEFEELCGKPLSAADYLEVTRAFPTVFVTEVPRMGLGEKDKARRFITFVDGESCSPSCLLGKAHMHAWKRTER